MRVRYAVVCACNLYIIRLCIRWEVGQLGRCRSHVVVTRGLQGGSIPSSDIHCSRVGMAVPGMDLVAAQGLMDARVRRGTGGVRSPTRGVTGRCP